MSPHVWKEEGNEMMGAEHSSLVLRWFTGSIFVTTAVTTRVSGDVIDPPCGEVNRERKKLFKEIGGLI